MTKNLESEAYSAESEESNLGSNEQEDSGQHGSSKATHTHKQSSESTGPTPRYMTTLRQSILAVFLASTCSLADSPAKTSAMLESELASRGVVLASGSTTPVPLARYDRDSSSLRTWQHSLGGDSTPFCVTLPRSGMMRNGTVYQLAPLVRLTAATGYSSWPTPNARDWHPPQTWQVEQNSQGWTHIKKNGQRYGASLAQVMTAISQNRVQMWPTPTAVTNTGGAALCKWGGAGARAKLRTMVSSEELNGALNPTWVEWLMGFPSGWTVLSDSATASFRKSRKQSGRQ